MTIKVETQIAKALETLIPKFKEEYELRVPKMLVEMCSKFGPMCYDIYNSVYASQFTRAIRPNTVVISVETGKPVSSYPHRSTTVKLVIDEERLARNAQRFAEAQAFTWKTKLEKKLQDLDQVEIKLLRGTNFLITGMRDGHKVQIDQDTIINCSSKGMLFNQFPARIHVDGKFISEKKYKETFSS